MKIKLLLVLLSFVPVIAAADGPSSLAYDGKDLVSKPTAEDLRIIQDKFDKSKVAYNDGDFFWKDPEPYYFLNGKDIVDRYAGMSLEKFLQLKTQIQAPYNDWVDPKNYARIMASHRSITVNEAAELIDYTYNSFRAVNDALFAEDASRADKETVASIRYLNRTLQKLPPVEAGATLYRCDYWPKDGPDQTAPVPSHVTKLFDKKNVGQTITHAAFMSTTRAIYAAAQDKFVKNCPYLRVIRTKGSSGARDILGFSDQNAYEEEALFLPRTRLLIQKLDSKSIGNEKTQLILYMQEQ